MGILPVTPKPFRILPVASGLGAPPWAADGCAAGADALLATGMVHALEQQGVTVALSPTIVPDAIARREALAVLCRNLADRVESAIEAGELPLILGGDHAIAAGTWRGATRNLEGSFGLLWIDAHLDAHTPDDTPSGNWHGMPLAALLGSGAREFTAIAGHGPDPAHVCIVGVRSYESSELGYLCGRHVRIFGMSEIRRKGLPEVMREALARVCRGTTAWGLSLDLDAMSPSDAPGVSTPAENGMDASELVAALKGLARFPGLLAIEVVEYNPKQDQAGRTAALVLTLMKAMLD
jgi:arginase